MPTPKLTKPEVADELTKLQAELEDIPKSIEDAIRAGDEIALMRLLTRRKVLPASILSLEIEAVQAALARLESQTEGLKSTEEEASSKANEAETAFKEARRAMEEAQNAHGRATFYRRYNETQITEKKQQIEHLLKKRSEFLATISRT